MKPQTLFAVLGVLVSCNDEIAPQEPELGLNAPRVHIVSPARGAVAGDVNAVLVTGTVSDDSSHAVRVTVNGVPARVAPGGTWVAEVGVTPGTNLVHAIATDANGTTGTETRAIVAGPMVALDGHVANGIRASFSEAALIALGRGTATSIETGGLLTTMQGMNPVVDVRATPECFYAQASITSTTVADADVATSPTTGGISVAAVLDNVRIEMRLDWAVSCVSDSRTVVLTAERVSVHGLLAMGVVDRKLEIKFDDSNVQVTGFTARLTDVPEAIVQMVELDSAISGILGTATERLVVALVQPSVAVLDDTKTIDVAGVQVDVDVVPTQISFTPEGGTLTLETSLRAHGDSGQLVFVPNTMPTFDTTKGFELAVADDAVNQLLTSLWSAKAFDVKVDFEPGGGYGAISEIYDYVQLQLMAPPHVEASGSPLQLTIGDWIATFTTTDGATATVAIHAKSALYVVEVGDGKLRMDVSTPSVDVDIIEGGASITKAQYQAIRSFAFERIHTLGAAAVAAIPLPAVGDAMVTNLWVDPRAGYLLVGGNLR